MQSSDLGSWYQLMLFSSPLPILTLVLVTRCSLGMQGSDHLVSVPVTSHTVPATHSVVTCHAIAHATHRLPVHTARGTAMVSMSASVSSRSLSLRHHGTAWAICSIARRTSPACALNGAPASLAGEDVGVEAVEGAWACAVDKGSVAEEGNVVEAEVPDGGVDHAVGRESHHCADHSASEDVVPDRIVSI